MKISVVIPVHNGGKTFQRCLDALSKTIYDNWECIVVDDYSTDNTVCIAQKYGVRVFSSPENRVGPAEARNIGAQVARGDILLFLDADVLVQPGTIGHVAAIFKSEPHLDACFGSYDDAPTCENFLSQYRTLQQFYAHQHSPIDSSIFRSKCGAIRRSLFLTMGGFNASAFTRPGIEDIELGYRLHRDGYDVRLERLLQVKHMKAWQFRSMVLSDIRDRAIPWTQLILRDRFVPDDLNLQTSQRLSTAILGFTLIALVLTLASSWMWVLFFATILQLIWLNRQFYQFLLTKRGVWFTSRAIPVHWFYFFYTGLAFLLGVAIYNSVKLTHLLLPPQNKPFYSATIHPFDTR